MKDDPDPMVGSGTVDDSAERLTRTIRDQSSPNLRPRDSATLILIDRSGTVPKVLLGRRHERHRFLPGKFVFPGGRVEIKDRLMPTAAPLHARDTERLMQRVKRPSLAKAAAYALAAIRETYEETGLMLGAPSPALSRRRPRPGSPSPRPASSPTSAPCISSAVPSPRPAVRAGSTAAFSPPTSMRSCAATRALSAPTRSWSKWSGCRSPRRASSISRHHRHRAGRAAGPDRNRHEP